MFKQGMVWILIKRLLCIVLVMILLFSASCDNNNADLPATDDPAIEENNREDVDEGDKTPAATEEKVEEIIRMPGIPVNWGTTLSGREIDPASPVLEHFHRRFGVDLNIMRIPPDLRGDDPIPDIFFSENARNTALALYEQGVTRAIPRNMIERHAPNYAALLDSIPYGWELGRIGDTDNYIGLFVFDITKTYMTDFSIYRLDWMEKLGIAPPGNPNDVENIIEGVYFTPHSFTQAEFLNVMQAFSTNELSAIAPINRGIGVHESIRGDFNTIHDPLSSLMGMWGLNLNNMNVNGRAMPYFATDEYRSFLTFMRQAGYTNDMIVYLNNEAFPRGFPASRTAHEAGWSSLHIDSIPDIFERQITLPTNRYLVTPPEIGPGGVRGGAGKHSGSLFNMESQWVISASLPDNFMGNVLQVFNALAFDPESYVIAMYGEDMRDYIWEGEKYNSGVVLRRNRRSDRARIRNGIGLFDTYMRDGNAGKMVYETGMTNPIYRYAASQQGLDMVNWPYRYDLTGDHAAAFNSIRNTRGGLYRIAREHYFLFLQDEEWPVGNAEWSEYLAALNNAGLQDYINYLSALDEVSVGFVAQETASTYVPEYQPADDDDFDDAFLED
jgi:hypothetical protein